ncbi:hypothetical protein B0H15DRAFT_805995 [Mycena belliarum]|uniref:Ribonuclease H1 N-terminal domain-containing protein n=1 Tax=Mycena belliarum TaxID=1033014 RepID=A0AAD6XHS0_9AGAR|nr:hypothetical protein B0H15DRAFT_805995 [Mycena belliae]
MPLAPSTDDRMDELAELLQAFSLPDPPSPTIGRRLRCDNPPPTSSPLLPQTPTRRGRLYYFDSPEKSGRTSNWSEAAAQTQGVHDAHVRRLMPKKKPRRKKGGYAVFYGRKPGFYKLWEVVDPLVTGVSCALYQGYKDLASAQAAFEYAKSKSWTRVCTSRPSSPFPAVPSSAAPIPQVPNAAGLVEPRNPLHGHAEDDWSPDSSWYVVYAGIHPGVYQSSLECGLNTVGLSCAAFDSARSKQDAIEMYQSALERNEVKVLQHPYS